MTLRTGSVESALTRCTNWDDFVKLAVSTDRAAKGRLFERLTQLYLQTQPRYRSKLTDVWLLAEVPADVKRHLNLPDEDEGIDLVAKTTFGEYWAIQSKFRGDFEGRLTRKELSTFTSLAFVTCDHISFALVAHTCSKPVRKSELMGKTAELGLENWLGLDEEHWSWILAAIEGETPKPDAYDPRPHQEEAISEALRHYVSDGESRGRLIMPCGTGKSLTAFWIAQALDARSIIVAVPSLILLKQSLEGWTREFQAHDERPDWLCVCSDKSVGRAPDSWVSSVSELGVDTTTKPDEIVAFLTADSDSRKILFTTYQSSDRVAEAAQVAGATFDFAVLDEAHKTVGVRSKLFATLLDDEKVPVRRRLFMTATERILKGKNDKVLSMDDEAVYGGLVYQLSFKKALEADPPILSDYRILTLRVGSDEVREMIESNRYLSFQEDEVEARALAAAMLLRRAFENRGVRHAISFHRSIKSAKEFAELNGRLGEDTEGVDIEALHVSSKKTTGQRAQTMNEFAQSTRALLTNARCLTEGVDIPAVDCVLFAHPKQSVVDIVQAAGRALRPYKAKEYGYIVLPTIVPEGTEFNEFVQSTEFKMVARTIAAMSTQDERIAEEFRAIESGTRSRGEIVDFFGDVPVGIKIHPERFAEQIREQVWRVVGPVNWRQFEDARAFVQKLGLKSKLEWDEFCKSGDRPKDIHAHPDQVYRGKGWDGMRDWLGTGWRSFEKARAFAHTLGLKGEAEWREYAKSGERPADIPSNPNSFYKGSGWKNWPDWLGTGRIATRDRKYRSFPEARAFVHTLGLKTQAEWREYAKSGKKPDDIPAGPRRVYGDEGWNGEGDWLGTGTVSTQDRSYRSFEDARAFVHTLGLKSAQEWKDYCVSGAKPNDIPSAPDQVYESTGWKDWPDWLGTEYVERFPPFKEARVFAHTLRLQSVGEWREYAKSGERPADIPSNPNSFYKGNGWKDWPDWLGYERRRRAERT